MCFGYLTHLSSDYECEDEESYQALFLYQRHLFGGFA